METTDSSNKDLSHDESRLIFEFAVDFKNDHDEVYIDKLLSNVAKVIKIDPDNDILIVQSSFNQDKILEMIKDAGYSVALIGSGTSGDISKLQIPTLNGDFKENLSCVAEFKGAAGIQGSVLGIVRIIQQTEFISAVQACIDGLLPETVYSIAIHRYGRLLPGETGPIFNESYPKEQKSDPIPDFSRNGILGFGVSDSSGRLEISNRVAILVWRVIGRSLVIHPDESAETPGIASSIIARSAAVGTNTKKVCLCDGTVIWDAASMNSKAHK